MFINFIKPKFVNNIFYEGAPKISNDFDTITTLDVIIFQSLESKLTTWVNNENRSVNGVISINPIEGSNRHRNLAFELVKKNLSKGLFHGVFRVTNESELNLMTRSIASNDFSYILPQTISGNMINMVDKSKDK